MRNTRGHGPERGNTPRRLGAASVLQASCFRGDVTVFRLNASGAGQIGSERAFRRNTAERVYTIEAAHNPEVAGSNPAPATEKGPGNGAFFLVRLARLEAPRWTVAATLCPAEADSPRPPLPWLRSSADRSHLRLCARGDGHVSRIHGRSSVVCDASLAIDGHSPRLDHTVTSSGTSPSWTATAMLS
jgi:hypothetical protein